MIYARRAGLLARIEISPPSVTCPYERFNHHNYCGGFLLRFHVSETIVVKCDHMVTGRGDEGKRAAVCIEFMPDQEGLSCRY